MALLAVPQPYDFDVSLDRFTFWGVDRANVWHDGGLHRVVDGREVRISPAREGVDVEPLDDRVEPVVRKLLAVEVDLRPFYAFARATPCWPRRCDGFPATVHRSRRIPSRRSCLRHGAAGVTSFGLRRPQPLHRAFRRAGIDLAVAFPTRERVAEASEDDLTALGFSRRKAEYVLGIARADLDFDELEALPDDEVKARLMVLRGIGEWSADWFLGRYLGRPQAWPAGDLALRKAVLALYPDVTDVRAAGVRFHPFQNLSAHYLLATLRYR